MDNLLTLCLEAHNDERNHHRHYQITVGRDLLDDWIVAIRYGRAGQPGREQRFAGTDAAAMREVIRDRLRRRLSAPRRIGCAYVLKELSMARSFEGSSWLPAELMARFFLLSTGDRDAKAA